MADKQTGEQREAAKKAEGKRSVQRLKRGNLSIAVLGLGTFGFETALALQEGGAHVLAVDSDEDTVNRIGPSVTRALRMNAADSDLLKQHGVYDMDVAVVAMKNHFEVTVVLTHLLKRAGVGEIHVQVNSDLEGEAIRTLGATSVIFPERDMAERIASHILLPGFQDFIPIGEDVSIVETAVPESFVGKTLIELDVRGKYGVTVIAVGGEKGARRKIDVSPDPNKPLSTEQTLYVIGKIQNIDQFQKLL